VTKKPESPQHREKPPGEDAPEPERSLRKRLAQAVGALGAVVALFVGITNLVDWLEARVTDDTSLVRGARIEAVDLRENVRLGSFVSDEFRDTYTKAELKQFGNVVSIRAHIQGYAGEELPIRYSIYDAETKIMLSGSSYNQVGVKLGPETQDHTGTAQMWVPLPNREGSFFIRLDLEDGEGEILDQRRTPRFDTVPLN
jgi:hypothetical protein